MNRRQFIESAAFWSGAGLALADSGQTISQYIAKAGQGMSRPHDALFWEGLPENKVRCKLCPHACVMRPGARGRCRVRENRNGKLVSLNYGQLCALHVDPIEKKPLFHFLPGVRALSLAAPGCNLACKYCQNWQISQYGPDAVNCKPYPPLQVVAEARASGTPVIAFTYSEPVVLCEYVLDTESEAHRAGLRNVVISNGYIQEDPLRRMLGHTDAIKVDFKGFSESFYSAVCQGSLKHVLESLSTIKSTGVWLEIVLLVVPTLNDDVASNKALFRWIVTNLSDKTPIHISRFQPCYQLANLPPTPVQTLEILYSEALGAGLNYVYIGNVPGHQGENTYCHSCKKIIIRRVGFNVVENHLVKGKCGYCATPIPGVFA